MEGVDDDPADPGVEGAAQLGVRSCCCRGSRSGPGRSPRAARRSARPASRRRGRALLRDPARDRRCRGRPCPRRRRRSPRTRRGSPRARAEVGLVEDVRRGAVLGDQVGTSTPPTSSSPPSSLCAVRDHSGGTSALASSGSRSHDGPVEGAGGVRPAGFVGRHRASTSARAR